MTAGKGKVIQSDPDNQSIPVLINPGAGSAEAVQGLLEDDPRVQLQILTPDKLSCATDRAIAKGIRRVAVCGGDGTLSLAASRLVGTQTELAVIPGGTLNHFASRLAIPTQVKPALELALRGQARPVGVGVVNDRLFLNTSSVGAYVTFVRSRDFLEDRHGMGYHLASLMAGVRRLVRLRSARIELNGVRLRSPLVFVGVGERDLQLPTLGQHKENGRNGLHLIAIRRGKRLETLKIVMDGLFRGIDPLMRARQLENQVLEQIELGYRRPRRKVIVAVDGELIKLGTPLRYRFAPQGLAVVTPPPENPLEPPGHSHTG